MLTKPMRVRPGFSCLALALAHRPMAAVPPTWSERKRDIEQQQQPEASGGVGCRISIAAPGASGTLLKARSFILHEAGDKFTLGG